MNIFSHLEVILLNVKARNHEGVLRQMAGHLLSSMKEWHREEVIHALKDHESINGVLFGSKAAIFHSLSEKIDTIKIAIAVSKRNIPHPAEKATARIFFLLISPVKESGTHLQLLSKLEGLLLNRAFRHAILSARTIEDVRKIIRREEEAGRSVYIPLNRSEVFSELSTSENGLSDKDALHRLMVVGQNILKKVEKGHLIKDFFYNLFLNLFAVLLWIGGIMAFVADMPQLGIAIFLVIIINAVFSFWQEYKAERAVDALQRLLPRKVKVIRDSIVKEIEASQIVPGDLIELSEGDSIPADGRLVSAEEMRVDNSPLTGESKPIYKVAEPVADGKNFIWTEIPNLVFAGTGVLSGSGRVVVTATGMDTEIGRVAYLAQAIKSEMSPLQREMVNVTKIVTLIAIALGAIFFFLGFTIAGLTFAESFIFAIGIIVANVPEGLLPTVSLSLAMGVQRMARRGAIVKKLSAVETLGSATVICTDKTGTLTTNQMCVKNLFVNGKLIEVTGGGYEPIGEFLYNGKSISVDDFKRDGIDNLLTASALCNNANLCPPSKEVPYWRVIGDPTEGALLSLGEKGGLKIETLRSKNYRVAHLPFESMRKRMTTIYEEGARGKGQGARIIAYVKGASNETLNLCTKIYLDEKVVNLTDEEREIILKQNDSMAEKGLRILAVACREMEYQKEYTVEETERDLTFIGLVAMFDPPREEVRNAVHECQSAGIRVVMITGDYGITAKTIAGQVGIARKDTKVITGEELDRLSHRELKEILRKGEVIFARAAPKDKLRVVSALQDNGEIVAVTGDGVNDAPALKKADIGIAMGIRGSDVAKESAEIILSDDNFATIVDAVREGRGVYANIKKFVTYIFASNIPEIVPFIAFVIFRIPLPLTVMQILAIDLGTDVVPALGLGVEPPEKGIMNQPPRPKDKRLLDFKLLARAYMFLGPIEAILCMAGFFFAYWLRGWQPGMDMPSSGVIYATATTMSLCGIVASQIGNVFACRTEMESVLSAGFFKNRLILIGIAIEVILILILDYTALFQKIFGLAPLRLNDWMLLLIFPIVVLTADEIRKYVVRKL
ncbi:MAG: HAD-IC family P-type ATPase [Nitrospinae bacterium]|nr:HAD-IC family P-type ATPase [Nitrospinota bacterium]